MSSRDIAIDDASQVEWTRIADDATVTERFQAQQTKDCSLFAQKKRPPRVARRAIGIAPSHLAT